MKIEELDPILKDLIARRHGYLLIKDVEQREIPRYLAYIWLSNTSMKKVASGTFALRECETDWMYVLQCRLTESVFSHRSALLLHGYIDHEDFMTITVPRGYYHREVLEKGIQVIQVQRNVLNPGIENVRSSSGNEVRTYNIHRTMAEIIRRNDDLTEDEYQAVLDRYFHGPGCDLAQLSYYGEMLHARLKVEKAIHSLR